MSPVEYEDPRLMLTNPLLDTALRLFHLPLPLQSVLGRVRMIAKHSICLSASMQQLGSHWTHFYEKRNVIFSENLSRKFKFC
jgi:hypothetical protein